ncbi:MAG: hypothetical protein IKM53_04720 [Clostridia bacterium]|nr:hypothetical protein [Clostridia bacterium]
MTKRQNSRKHDKLVNRDNEQYRNEPAALNGGICEHPEQYVKSNLKNELEKETEAQCNCHHRKK